MKQKYQGSTTVKRALLRALRKDFEVLQIKEGESVDEYFARTLIIVNKMKVHGESMEQVVIIEKILRSMTSRFDYVVCSVEESNNLDTLTIDELQSSLLVHEQRMNGRRGDEQALKVTYDNRSGRRGGIREARLDVLEWGDSNEEGSEHDQSEEEVEEEVAVEEGGGEVSLPSSGSSGENSQTSKESSPSSPEMRNRRVPFWLEDYEYNAKLSDFELFKYEQINVEHAIIITSYHHTSPEVITGAVNLNPKHDVYLFGVLLLEMLTGLRAFDINRPSDERNLVKWAAPVLCNPRKVKKIVDQRLQHKKYPSQVAMIQAAEVIHNCLNQHPTTRPSMDQVLQTLQHIKALDSSTV
ncbi:hypothetical protein LWI28_029133 [Acer negundo]|uniref:Protein kinase domain-containing protein n=1 Tax=Acer negundo TaxID=4023 RepID=A0AAD5IC39_ACENE|nr:hypothetical protein LWI28_029133 [Acer negundo]